MTKTTYACKSNGDWSPCAGGQDAKYEGDGYCESNTDGGYRGPRCELCLADHHYFDELEARCYYCGNVSAQATAALCSLFFLCLAALGLQSVSSSSWCTGPCLTSIKRKIHTVRKLYRRAGMRYKIKALIGLYQCVAAIPSVFNVTISSGLAEYAKWILVLEFPVDLSSMVIPAACYGSFRTRLVVGSIWPIALLLVVSISSICMEIFKDLRKRGSLRIPLFSNRKPALTGLYRVLLLFLITTFILVSSTSTRIFKTFHCDRFAFDDAANRVRRYLNEDLGESCETDEYGKTQTLAIGFLLLWPVGASPARLKPGISRPKQANAHKVPTLTLLASLQVALLYLLLLWASRRASKTDSTTQSSQATAFLSAEGLDRLVGAV
eukprot:3940953-Prymnesium_polylepis.1